MDNVTILLQNSMDDIVDGSRQLSERIIEMIIMSLILGISVAGNLCVCYLILRDARLKKLSYVFIFNLALTDLGLSSTCIPISLTVLHQDRFIFSETVCYMNGTIMLIFGIASLLNLAVISVTRYISVCKSTFAKLYFTKSFYIGAIVDTVFDLLRMKLGSITAIWVASFLIAFPPLIGWGRMEFSYGSTACVLNWPSSISFTVFIMILSIFLPFGIIVLSYVLLFYNVWKSKQRVRSHSDTNVCTFKRSDLKLAKVSLSVFVSFIICWVPVSVTIFLLLVRYHVPIGWSMFAMLCMYLNSLCNPVIYPLMSIEFRLGFKRFLCPCLKIKTHDTTVSTIN